MPSPIRDGVMRLLRLPLRTRAQIDADADEELQSFLAERIDHLMARGLSASDARDEALRRLGPSFNDATHQLHSSARTRERRMSMREMLDDLMQDLRYAFRTLHRDARFALFAIVIVGLGIGASVTVFSVANALLIRPLPFTDPDNLAWIRNGDGSGGMSGQTSQVNHMLDLRAGSTSFTDIAAYYAFAGVGGTRLTGGTESMRLTMVPVSVNFFPLLGVRPLLGRQFTAEEGLDNGPKSVMISYSLWQRRFNSDAGIVGTSVLLDDQPFNITAVMPADFDFGSVFNPGTHVDLYTPLPLTDRINRQGNTIMMIGRMKPGVTIASSNAETHVLAARIVAEHSKDRNEFAPMVMSLRQYVSGGTRSALVLLSLAVFVVMLIVCANLSNLLLARATTRQKEMAVRVALGAGRRRLMRQMLTESIVLSFCGAALGLMLAYVGTRVIAGLNGVDLPLLENVHIDASALGVTIFLAIVAGLAFGLAPALQIPSSAVHSALKESSRSATGGKRGNMLRSSLVVSEIALACMLLVGAGLLARSFLKVLDVDMGFKPEMVTAIRVDPSRDFMQSQERFIAYVNEAMERTRQIPGIKSVAISDGLPLGSNRTWGVSAKGQTYKRGDMPQSYIRITSDRYIETMGMRLVSGRDFTPMDAEKGEPVIIINQTLARTLWPRQDAVGQFMKADRERRVIGVVKDVRHLALERESGSELYLPIRQSGDFSSVQLVVRSTLPPASFVNSVRKALEPIAPNLPTNEFHTLQQMVDASVSPRRFMTVLLGGFAAFALVLALLGIYGVISYTVNHRTQEIGVRMALGASAAQLQGRIIRETLLLAGIGMIIGTVASLVLARALGSLLFGVTATDPVTFGAMLVVLTVVATVSGWVPARRAARIDPMTALRGT